MPSPNPENSRKASLPEKQPRVWRRVEALGTRAVVDLPVPEPRNARLECLERREFTSSRAHVALELVNHNVFITPLEAFDMPGDTRLHPIPEEFEMFTRRRERTDALLYAHGNPTTRRLDHQERKRGVDVDQRMFTLLQQFLEHNPRGQKIMADTGLYDTAIDQLTPKESLYLVGYLMEELTNYDRTQSDEGDNRRPYDIIANGIAAPSKEGVKPLGVCRNFADTGEALFLALKSRNPRLTNIYCSNTAGFQGALDGQFHREGAKVRGHVWLDFACVDEAGNMAITTVDPTWAKRDGRNLTGYDQTVQRIGVNLRNLAAGEQLNYSSHKERNLERVTTFYAARTDKMVEMLKKRYPTQDGRLHLRDVPADDHLYMAAMYTAVDYVISGREFGGTAFAPLESKDPTVRKMVTFVYQAALRKDFIFSNSEYGAVLSILGQMWRKYPDDREKVVKHEAALKARHSAQMAKPANSKLFEQNEGDFAGTVI